MPKVKEFLVALAILAALALGLIIGCNAQAPSLPLAGLTRLSDREFVDLSKVVFVRLPVTVDLTEYGGDPAWRTGDTLVVGAAQVGFTVEAEAKLRELLGVR